MKISNQIEHLRNLFNELRYMEVIQFGTITLPITLEEKGMRKPSYAMNIWHRHILK